MNTLSLLLETGDTSRLRTRVLLEQKEVPWCDVSYRSLSPSIATVDERSGVVIAADSGDARIGMVRATLPPLPCIDEPVACRVVITARSGRLTAEREVIVRR